MFDFIGFMSNDTTVLLASYYKDGLHKFSKDEKKAFEIHLDFADKGVPQAIFTTFFNYLDG